MQKEYVRAYRARCQSKEFEPNYSVSTSYPDDMVPTELCLSEALEDIKMHILMNPESSRLWYLEELTNVRYVRMEDGTVWDNKLRKKIDQTHVTMAARRVDLQKYLVHKWLLTTVWYYRNIK